MNIELTAKQYDDIAVEYHYCRTHDLSFYTEYLELPAMLGFIENDLKNKKILDLGCSTGILTQHLQTIANEVKGCDISTEMLKIAIQNNPNVKFCLSKNGLIPFDDGFDIVVASLVLDNIADWNPLLQDVKRILNQDGLFIFSLINPISECGFTDESNSRVLGSPSYFSTDKLSKNWKANNKIYPFIRYHKTYEQIISLILENGFEINGYKDAQPIKSAKDKFPEQYALWSRVPKCCIWKIRPKREN